MADAAASSADSSKFAQLVSLERRPEEPRGDMDLMAFYNLLRLYERLGKPGNYCKQLADTSFASYQWHRGSDCGLASVDSLSGHHPSETVQPFTAAQLETLKFQLGRLELTEAEMGPLVDTSAFGEAVPQNADKRKREEDKKAKKSKKEKREKGEKRKRSEEKSSQAG